MGLDALSRPQWVVVVVPHVVQHGDDVIRSEDGGGHDGDEQSHGLHPLCVQHGLLDGACDLHGPVRVYHNCVSNRIK